MEVCVHICVCSISACEVDRDGMRRDKILPITYGAYRVRIVSSNYLKHILDMLLLSIKRDKYKGALGI